MRCLLRLFGERQILSCGVLVIGGGGAGLRCAIAARLGNADVLLVSKTRIGRATNTFISKSVIAATGWGPPDDDEHVHAVDTIRGGRFLNDQSMVSRMAAKVRDEIAFLRDSGVRFGMKEGSLRLLKTPGHSYPRHVHGENWFGSDLVRPLEGLARRIGVRFADRIFITSLLAANGRITGATGVTPDGTFVALQANTIVLATGGYAQVFLNTNNAFGITGDGQALAYDLGIPLKDMEFVQFYPTAAGKRGNRLVLYERVLAQKGATLKNNSGVDIIGKHGITDIMAVTRDQLAQLVMQEINDDPSGRRHVIMDLEALSADTAEELKSVLPPAWWKGQRRFHVAPTAHFCMGGVVTNQNGETSLDGLFAVGEIAAGIHGANRLGGNALAEIFAMGSLVGENAAKRADEIGQSILSPAMIEDEAYRLESLLSQNGLPVRQLITELKELMWDKAGVIRTASGLEEALKRLQEPSRPPVIECPSDAIRFMELRNMRLVAAMVCRAALERTESRGSHFRGDHPSEDDKNWLKNIWLRKEDTGLTVEARPVRLELIGPES